LKRGRPPIADSRVQLPATTVSTVIYDELCRRAFQRGTSLAQAVRDALSHLKNSQQATTSA